MNSPKLKVSMIAAVAQNWVIGGKSGGIPWTLPRDSQRFRTYTAGKFMLLGRTTYEEMNGWFTTQTPIVLTRKENYEVSEGFVADSVEKAISIASENGAAELVVSGGASVYDASLRFADELVLTLISADIEGERRFPDYGVDAEWDVLEAERFEADAENELAMTFVTLKRLRK